MLNVLKRIFKGITVVGLVIAMGFGVLIGLSVIFDADFPLWLRFVMVLLFLVVIAAEVFGKDGDGDGKSGSKTTK